MSMSGNFTGMDIGAVRGLAGQMDGYISQVNDILSKLTASLGHTSWTGADASRFRDQWQNQHIAELRSVISGLTDAAGACRRNAGEQEGASA